MNGAGAGMHETKVALCVAVERAKVSIEPRATGAKNAAGRTLPDASGIGTNSRMCRVGDADGCGGREGAFPRSASSRHRPRRDSQLLIDAHSTLLRLFPDDARRRRHNQSRPSRRNHDPGLAFI